MIDDHSRVCVASRVMHVVKAHDVVRVLHKSAETWGYPASFLGQVPRSGVQGREVLSPRVNLLF
jgi:hypothetical protein